MVVLVGGRTGGWTGDCGMPNAKDWILLSSALGLGWLSCHGDCGVDDADLGTFGDEVAGGCAGPCFCDICCCCIFFRSFWDIFGALLAVSEILAFIASVKFEGLVAEASAMMSLSSILEGVDLVALQGVPFVANPVVVVFPCGVRAIEGEAEYCGR